MIFVKAINEEVSFLKKKEAVFIGALLVISVVLCIFVYAVPHGTHGSIQITLWDLFTGGGSGDPDWGYQCV